MEEFMWSIHVALELGSKYTPPFIWRRGWVQAKGAEHHASVVRNARLRHWDRSVGHLEMAAVTW